MKVLVTGFEPNGNGLNASKIVVGALQKNLPVELSQDGDQMYFQILPGDTHRLSAVIEDSLTSLSPDICIGVGQARGYNKIAIERMAKNLRYFVTPDEAGNTPQGVPIISDAAIAYWYSLHNLEGLVPLLENHHIPARVMNDCGTHLCNQAFYHYLHWKERCKPSMRVGFVHIPAVPEQVIKHWPEAPFMPLEMTCEALALIISSQLEA